MSISVILVDDHPLFRKGLVHLLANQNDIKIVGEFADVSSTREWLNKGGTVDVAILDRILREEDGLALLPELKQKGTKVIMLTIADQDYEVREAISKGADGYILKTSEPEQIIQAIVSISNGHSMFPSHIMQKMIDSRFSDPQLQKLSQRELEIVSYVASGMSNRNIGEVLELSENTVRNHLRSILDKLGLKNRVQVATFALKRGITKSVPIVSKEKSTEI